MRILQHDRLPYEEKFIRLPAAAIESFSNDNKLHESDAVFNIHRRQLTLPRPQQYSREIDLIFSYLFEGRTGPLKKWLPEYRQRSVPTYFSSHLAFTPLQEAHPLRTTHSKTQRNSQTILTNISAVP